MGNNSLIKRDYKEFEIDASWCNLRIGTNVTPGTIVGKDYETGELIEASDYGQVATISFNPTHHSLLINIAIDKT